MKDLQRVEITSRSIPVFAAVLLVLAACAQPGAPSRPVAAAASPTLIASICAGPTRAVRVLRNSAGDIGGYVAIPSIMDSPIAYHDANGELLAVFHIFDSETGKASASATIERLRTAFPLEEIVPCTTLRP